MEMQVNTHPVTNYYIVSNNSGIAKTNILYGQNVLAVAITIRIANPTLHPSLVVLLLHSSPGPLAIKTFVRQNHWNKQSSPMNSISRLTMQ